MTDDDLPGMWSHSDFEGGDPDERSYLERGLERAAFAAFCRNMAEYDFEPGNLHLAFYGDEGVRDFWVKESRAWWEAFREHIRNPASAL